MVRKICVTDEPIKDIKMIIFNLYIGYEYIVKQ